MMKNLYLYLVFTGLVIAGITNYPVSQEHAGYELQKHSLSASNTPQAKAIVKRPAYLPLEVTPKSSRMLLAPLITAQNTVAVTNDQGLPGASAGDELEYTITIANGGTTEATGVKFEDVLDVNTTLVPNSIVAAPVAMNDSYNTIGNVGLDIPAAQGVLTNDANPGSSAMTITTTSPLTTTQGGTVTLNANTGAFKYVAPAGYSGADSFTYEVGNGTGATGTATVNIEITGRIWFINSSADAAGANGTLQKPFTSIAAFQTINTGNTLQAQNNDLIYIYTGAGNYESRLTLRSGQKLIGQGAQASILAISGYGTPSGTNQLPATSGVAPVLTSTQTSTNVITLNTNNTIRGLNINSSTEKKIIGNNFGKLVVNDVALTGTGAALQLTGGELDATFSNVSSAVSNVSAIQLSSTNGKLTISGGTITASAGSAVNISGVNSAQKLDLDVQFTALNADNTAKGIILNNTSGAFRVLGNGSTAGSGGTISNITQRGVDLNGASGVVLKYVNFNNANTAEGTPVSNGDNINCNAAIHANNVSGLTLDNISISGTTVQQGINLKGVSNFQLQNSTVTNCGNNNEQEEGCIYAVNTSGNSLIIGSKLSKPSGRVAYFRNTNTNLAMLTVDNSEFTDAYNSAGFLMEGWGNSTMNLKVMNGSKFLRNQTTGIAVYANENTLVKADILNSLIDPTNAAVSPDDIGLGMDLAGSGTSSFKFNVLHNVVKAKGGNAVNVFMYENSFGEGTIDANTITVQEGGGAGIRVHNEAVILGNLARGVVKVSNNTIGGVSADSGIKIENNSFGAGRVDATIEKNTVSLNPASVSTSFYNIDIVAPGVSNNTGIICANVASNIIPSGNEGELGIARFRAGASGTKVLLQGGGNSAATNWTANGNTAGTVVATPSLGTFTYGATCTVPSNPALRVITPEAVAPEKVSVSVASTSGKSVMESAPAPVEANSASSGKKTSGITIRKATALAGETILIDGGGNGFTIPANKSVVIKFKAIINSAIPAGTCSVGNQGTVTGTGFAATLTDDPAAAGTDNPTTTTVVSSPVFLSTPANVTRDLKGTNCVSTESLPATAASCPAPDITYSIAGTEITFPYDFPTGVTKVDVVASNGLGTDAVTSYTVTVNCTALPVTLINFSGTKENQTTVLKWSTTAETNSEAFQVERSSDGKRWENIGTVKAKGESASLVPYTFTDRNPVISGNTSGENLYRLKMVDRDGTYAYSRIVSLLFEADQPVVLYPNPVSDELRILAKNWHQVTAVEIVSLGGATVYQSGKAPSERVTVKDLQPGTYLVRIRQKDGSTSSYKFVIAR